MQRKSLLLACLLVCADCFAQQYPFVYYTPNDGLINSRVRGIKQDTRGRMYFITHGGLSVYDGKRFINYDRRHGLANELVNDIVEITPDSFLLVTNAPTLNTLVHGKVGVFETADSIHPVINRLSKCSDGHWYAAADEGLFRLEQNRFIKITLTDPSGAETGCCLDKILEWKNYLVLVLWNHDIREKLIVYDRLSGKVSDIETKTQVLTATSDPYGQLWVSTNNGLRLLDTAALTNGKINLLPVPKKYLEVAGSNETLVFFETPDKAWFYREGLVSVFTPEQTQTISSHQGLKTFALTDLFVDREGTMWMATDGNGIMKLRNANIQLLNSIGQQRVSCQGIATKNDTTWFFNSENNTIYRFFKNKYTLFPLLGEPVVVANLYIQNKKLYLVTPEKLMCVEDKNDPGSFRKIKTILLANKDRRLGYGMICNDGTIIQYAVEEKTKYLVYVVKDDGIAMKYPITHASDQMCFDKMGRLWLTTRDNRVFAFTIHPDQPARYIQLMKGYPKELPSKSPRSIAIDSNYHVWIGTRFDGIYQYESRGDQLALREQYTTEQGLTDNFVLNLTCDNKNTIWAATQSGIDRIYRKNERRIIGNISKSNNFFQTVYKLAAGDDNTVWALTGDAILRLGGSELPSTSLTPPPLLLTSLEVNNQPYHDSSKNFSSQDNNLTFSVAAPSFIDERSVRYSYLLEGSAHTSWSTPTNNATFNFINLAPGDYTLKIRSDFPELIYPPQMLIYDFSIRPPWWQTWWFRLGMAALVLALLLMLTRYYYRRKLEKQKNILERKQAIEKERTRIATDMHDDLGAGLSRIKFLSETIGIKKQKQEPVEEDIDKIRAYSHEMIDKMGEIVWALNEKNDSLSDLLSYTRVYAMQYLSENGIQCTVDTPAQFPSLFISGEFRRNIYLTVKEALHNVVKHAGARQVMIYIETGPFLCITISDDGNGFDVNNIRPLGNGLNNMKRRIESIEGSLQIVNGNGTTVAFSVPLP